jgi:hypothetical protein
VLNAFPLGRQPLPGRLKLLTISDKLMKWIKWMVFFLIYIFF